MNRDAGRNLVHDALAQARRMGGRDVVFAKEGVRVVDVLGVTHPLSRSGKEIHGKPEVLEYLEPLPRIQDNSTDSSGIVRFEELGQWHLLAQPDHVILRARRPIAPSLDSIVTFDPEDIARIRSLYNHKGVDIVLMGPSLRSRDVALSIASEMRHLGMRTELDVTTSEGTASTAFRRRETFDDMSSSGQRWEVGFRLFRDRPAVGQDRKDAISRFLVLQGNSVRSALRKWRENQSDRPLVFVSWGSTKVAKVEMNAAAASLANAKTSFAAAPWDRVAEVTSLRTADIDGVLRTSSSPSDPSGTQPPSSTLVGYSDAIVGAMMRRALRNRPGAREKAAPSIRAAKTAPISTQDATSLTRFELPTIEEVAKAFVNRSLPRAFIVGRQIFFHGPAAYALDNRTPVAAIVPDDLRNPILLVQSQVGKEDARGVAIRETVDAIRAAGEGKMEIMEVPDLCAMALLEGTNLIKFAGIGRMVKDKGANAFCDLTATGLSAVLRSDGIEPRMGF